MTKEEKDLLLKDLCTRLPYGVKIYHKSIDVNGNTYVYDGYILHEISSNGECISLLNLDKGHGVCEVDIALGEFKPYLRPMSSMTEEEGQTFTKFDDSIELDLSQFDNYLWLANIEQIDWLNTHHFDYRGLIEKGLAIEASEEIYGR